MNLRRVLAIAALAATSLAAGALALDRIFPPDLSRYHERSSETVDANGRLLRAFTTADGKWRLKTTVDDVDPVYLALLKVYEDRRFDDHWGIDPLAAARAASQWVARGRIVSGASTISMQAARLLEPRRRGLLTKAIQSARALQLEWRYSKREVLAIYLTLAPMGGNLEGVRAASFAYFGKEPRQLSAAEAALLVAIPQSPERRRPERAGKSAQAARDRVLVRGLEHGIIDQVLFDKAASRPVPDRRLAMPMQAPHLAAWLAGAAITEWTARVRPLAPGVGARLGHLPRAAHGMTLAHLGVAVVIAGVTASTAWKQEHIQTMAPGETIQMAGYTLRFDGAQEEPGPNYDAMRGSFVRSGAREKTLRFRQLLTARWRLATRARRGCRGTRPQPRRHSGSR